MDEYLTLREVATLLKLDTETVRKHVVATTIPAKKIGGSWRVSRTELDEWLKTRVVSG